MAVQSSLAGARGALKQVAFSVLLISFGFVGSLSLAELLLRVLTLNHKHEYSIYRRERPVRYYFPVGAHSLQGNSYYGRKPNNGYRISAVGDSFTFGSEMHYYDAYPGRLQTLLKLSESNRSIEVMNFGTSGLSTHHEILLVRKALALDSDIVLLQITLNDAQKSPLTKQEWQADLLIRPELLPFESAVLELVNTRWNSYFSRSNYIAYHKKLFSSEQNWRRFSNAIRHMKVLTEERKVPFLVVLFPLFDFILDESYPFFDIHQKIGEFIKSEGIPFLDIRDGYYGIAPERLQIRPGEDSHPNEVAHRIAADMIYRWLKSLRVLPQELRKIKMSKSRVSVDGPLRLNH